MKRIAIITASLVLSACSSLNPVTLDTLAYSQYVGVHWLVGKLHEGCSESSNINSNLPLLVSRSEELLIYATHRQSSMTEKSNAEKLVKLTRGFMTRYQKEPDLKTKRAICEEETTNISETTAKILKSLGGVDSTQ